MQRSRLNQIIKEELDRALSEGPGGYRVPGVSASAPRGTTDAAGYRLGGGGARSAMGGPIPADYVGKRSGPKWSKGDRGAISFDRAFSEFENTPMEGTVDAGDHRGGNVAGSYELTFARQNYGARVNLTFFEDGTQVRGMVEPEFDSPHDAVGAAIKDAKSRY